MGRGGEIKGNDVKSLGLMAAVGGERGLIRDLIGRDVRAGYGEGMLMFRSVIDCPPDGVGDLLRDFYVSVRTDILAGGRYFDRFRAEANRQVSWNERIERGHCTPT